MEPVIVGTAGHIDHGKTTLVRLLTGVDTDRLPEERRRGITIELGFAPLRLDGAVAGVVDVPGHEAFVRTMVAGATGVDVALVVVAADEGVMPQTREHLAILRLLGVRRAVVALTKRDLADDEWAALVHEDVRAALADGPFADAAIVETDAAGRGIDALRALLAGLAAELPSRRPDDLFRLPVDRAFVVKGTGVVVTGTVWSGTIARDATVRVQPAGLQARVRGVQAHGEGAAAAAPGGRVALALAGVALDDVRRGATLVAGDGWAPTLALRADVELLPDADPPGPRTRLRLHLGTAEVGARVVAAGGVRAGAPTPARVVLDAPLVARAGDRFVLRGGPLLTTLGGGVVTDPLPGARRPRPWPAPGAGAARRLAWLLAGSGAAGLERASLPVRLGLPPAEAALLASSAGGVAVGGRLYDTALVAARAERLHALVDEEHRLHPLEDGLSLQTVRARLGVADALADQLVRAAVAGGALELRGGVLRRAGREPEPDAAQARLLAALGAAIAAAGAEPPTVEELVREHGADARPLLRLLERRGALVPVGDRYYQPAALAALLDRLAAGMAPGVAYAPAELRELLGVSRRLAMPLLEHADRAGLTVRDGDGRTLAAPAR